MANEASEQSALLRSSQDEQSSQVVDFTKWDEENPRNWSRLRKLINVVIIALMAFLSPLASAMFSPGIDQIADDFKVPRNVAVGATTTGFVVLLGIGPLFLAPLSETFGRRKLYLTCFSIFSLLQIPTALSPNIQILIVVRALSGFFGSVGIANGGGTISDMFHPTERAAVFGWYLLGPLLGPAVGPLLGGVIIQNLGWRWVFWVLTIICAFNTILGFLFLKESYAPIILDQRKSALEKESLGSTTYHIANEDPRPLRQKIASSMSRPLRILFTQPVVLILAFYQATIFGTNYSLYTNFPAIYGPYGYGFSTTVVGLLYLGPGAGFLIAVLFIVPKIDTIFNRLTARNDHIPHPEFRLPLANIGAVLIPLSLLGFAWTVDAHAPWYVTVLIIAIFGLGQITVFNTVQNYYIDAFPRYAASAIAAGALFRSLGGGLLPLAAPALFEKIGYGWGLSAFAFLNLAMSPFPLLFYRYGETIRTRFAIQL